MIVAERWLVFAIVSISVACKREPASEAAPNASAGASVAAVVPSAAPKPAAPWYAGTWSGNYSASAAEPDTAPGALKDWAKDDGKHAAGQGSLKLTIDEQGLASGDAEGALGAQAVSGSADSDTIRLALAPKAAGDELKAFRATAVVRREGDVLRGTLHAGSGDGVTLRKASVELRRAGP